uniref:TGF-beta family profile domain-containing protein n=1 Tax=Zonotrichia albicollis TaxID=44394 RepID=A0A8D2N496_ZONAL
MKSVHSWLCELGQFRCSWEGWEHLAEEAQGCFHADSPTSSCRGSARPQLPGTEQPPGEQPFPNPCSLQLCISLGKGLNLFPFPGDTHSVDLLFSLDRVTEHDFSSQVCPSISHSLAFSLHSDVRKRKWVEMDVTSFLRPLIAMSRRNVHMALNFTCLTGDPQGSTKLGKAMNVTLVPPSLLLYLNDTSEQAHHRGSSLGASRQRRNENPKAAPASSPHNLKQFAFPPHECELHNFRLSFSQLRWDRWIIAPHRYSPQFCRGDCPRALGQRYGSPVHTMVQTLIYERLDPAVPRPSCVPAAYSPLSVLTIEPDGSIAYKEYEDMIATKCTCR